MLKIAICDDEKYFVQKIKNILIEYLENRKIQYEIDTFYSGIELVDMGIEIVKYQIVFLDINMKQLNGMETAEMIRKYSQDIYLVFVTAYVDYSLEGYKVGAIRYLLKDDISFADAIYECVNAILDKMNYVVCEKTFKFNEGEKKISLERILYIESRLHKVEFHIMENKLITYTLYDTLTHLEKEMQKFDFLRIHQSFLVNLKHVKSVRNYKVILSNNQKLMIPKARYKDVKNAFIAYKGEL